MEQKIFFQSSMPRALSTMLQNIVGQNPDFHVTPTDGLLELLFGARANFTNSPEFKAQNPDLMNEAFKGFCLGGIQGYVKGLTDKPYLLNKSRGWGVYRGFIETFYPNPKIICMVRNLKDVVASYEKIYRNNQLQHDPIRNDSSGKGTTLHKRVDEWMHPTNTIGRAVERIFETIRLGYDDKILFVKCEDLCLYPDAEMVRIYDYLGVAYYKHDFDNIQQITSEDDSVYGLSNDLHTIRPKLQMKPSDADAILGKDITQWIYDTYKWYYQKFNYQK
jgi:sulfotransferase